MSLVLSEPHPDVDKVILSVRELQNIRAEYERLRSINAELLTELESITGAYERLLEAYGKPFGWGFLESQNARAAIERAKA